MRFLMVVAALILSPVAACSSMANGGVQRALKTVPLTIKTARSEHRFRVEVAVTEAEQARGMMFRDKLADYKGMIFPFEQPRVASFWMKNCPHPLDMIFIRADGSIARIAAETTPFSLEPYTSGEPVAAVLEIRGGRAAELGIQEDDKVSWPR